MPRRWPLIALLLVAPGAPRAEVSLGVRLGFAPALGDANGSLAMAEWVGAQAPIQVDLLLRVTPRLSVGAYASYGFGLAKGDALELCELFGCLLAVIRTGVQATYEFPGRPLVPWVGAGAGYEWNTLVPITVPGSVTFGGVEWLNLQGGADWRLGSRWAVGPFLSASFGRYASGTTMLGEASPPASPPEAKMHAWLQAGLRGRFDF